MKVVFRVDSSDFMGAGHVMRCLTLAEELKLKGHMIYFACLRLPGDLRNLIIKRGYKVYDLTSPPKFVPPMGPDDYPGWLQRSVGDDARDFISIVKKADLVITDHYAIDGRWQNIVRLELMCMLLAIDDLARNHDADLIVDQTYARKSHHYTGPAKVLAGTDYAMLASNFKDCREKALDKKYLSGVPRILIFLGGADELGVTLKILKCLSKDLNNNITVLLNERSSGYSDVVNLINASDNITHLKFVDDMAGLMLEHDLGIGAAGTSTWERACVGLPSLVMTLADNQKEISSLLEELKISIVIGRKDINKELFSAIRILKEHWSDYFESSLRICDGRGVLRIVAEIDIICGDTSKARVSLVSATEEDIEFVYGLQTLPETRKYAHNPSVPNFVSHVKWMQSKLRDPHCKMYIIEGGVNNLQCGVLRLDRQSSKNYLISIFLDPQLHGQGIALSALRLADRWFPDLTLHAAVLEKNLPSQKLFQSAGYEKISDQKYVRKPIMREHYEAVYKD